MSNCPCDTPVPPRLDIAAGLDALPRQIRSFPEVRQALLEGLRNQPALQQWRAREGRDLGLMLLEMWAYVSDLLAFYDERIANESYLRTSARHPSQRRSLRRLVEMLGHLPKPGTASSAVLAAIAEGKAETRLPLGVAFRSDAFGDEAPQVFELAKETAIHPLKNEWTIPATRVGRVSASRFLIFESSDLGLARDRLALFEVPAPNTQAGKLLLAHKVVNVSSFQGKDGETYARVEFDSVVNLPVNTDPATVKVRTPSLTAVVTQSFVKRPDSPSPIQPGSQVVFLDTVYRQVRQGDPAIVAREAEGRFDARFVTSISEEFVLMRLSSPPKEDDPQVPVTVVEFNTPLSRTAASAQLNFHFGFADAGTLTVVGSTQLSAGDLARAEGLLVSEIVDAPPGLNADGELEQEFLLLDAEDKGARVKGRLVFGDDGRARFSVEDAALLPPGPFKTPITLFGNVIETTRGESVFDEVLGSGDPRQANQQFKLRKKPLTYLSDPSDRCLRKNTLEVRVDNVLWEQVDNFFGFGPDAEVYIVRHDEAEDTFVTFGDGVSGERLPSGVDNVIATYRFGAGAAAPPAGAIEQLSRPFVGLRGVRAPVAAQSGQDVESIDALRDIASRCALSFERAVSVADFEAFASQVPGIERVKVEFMWLEAQQQAGISVNYIGTPQAAQVKAALKVRGEENLPIQVVKATARPSFLTITVAFDERFQDTLVAQAVKDALTNERTGMLSIQHAEIGGRLWSSRLYRAVQEVAGVVSVQSATLVAGNESLDLGRTDVVCAPAGTYFDFDFGRRVTVTATSPIGAVPTKSARRRTQP